MSNYSPLISTNDFSTQQLLSYYDNTITPNVNGWFYPLDIAIFHLLIKHIIQSQGDLCELGVAYGKSAIALSHLKSAQENLYLYDLFEDYPLEQAQHALATYGNTHNLIWNKVDLYQLNLTASPFSQPLKFLHIDACHEHSYCLRDLYNFSPFVADDGVIVLDDINDKEYPGINTAMSEYLLSEQGKEWCVFAIGFNKAYLCKKSYFTYMRNALITQIISLFTNVAFNFSELFGLNVVLMTSRHPLSYEKVIEFLQQESQIA